MVGDQVSVFSYFEALENAIGEVRGQIQFAIDVNGRLTGMFIEGSESASSIILAAENVKITSQDGAVWQEWDSLSGTIKSYATIYAENIEGDITDGAVLDMRPITFDGSGTPGFCIINGISAHPLRAERPPNAITLKR